MVDGEEQRIGEDRYVAAYYRGWVLSGPVEDERLVDWSRIDSMYIYYLVNHTLQV